MPDGGDCVLKGQVCRSQILLTSDCFPWPEPRHMAPPDCKGPWERLSGCVCRRKGRGKGINPHLPCFYPGVKSPETKQSRCIVNTCGIEHLNGGLFFPQRCLTLFLPVLIPLFTDLSCGRSVRDFSSSVSSNLWDEARHRSICKY